MKKRLFVIICIGIFAAAGIIAGIANCIDSSAGEEKAKVSDGAVYTEDELIVNDDNKTKNGNTQTAATEAKGTSASKGNGDSVKKNGESGNTAKNSNENSTPNSKPAIKEPSKPSHKHNWEAVYKTRQVAHTRQVPWTKCYTCGADMTGNPGHIDQHLLNGDSNVHYGTEYRSETYYTSEQYVSGYKCSCGAVK